MSSQESQRRSEQHQPSQEGQQPHVRDNWETSFEGMLHAAVETLFTYRPIVERLAGANQDEEIQELIRERKLSLVDRLGGIAWEEVTDLAIDLSRVPAREQVEKPILRSAEVDDPYKVAWNVVETWREALQQLGQMRRQADLTEEEEFDDYHDELNRLYRRVCHDLELPWPPPIRDVDN